MFALPVFFSWNTDPEQKVLHFQSIQLFHGFYKYKRRILKILQLLVNIAVYCSIKAGHSYQTSSSLRMLKSLLMPLVYRAGMYVGAHIHVLRTELKKKLSFFGHFSYYQDNIVHCLPVHLASLNLDHLFMLSNCLLLFSSNFFLEYGFY